MGEWGGGVMATLEDALKVTGLKHARVHHKPRLLSDNGPCYISGEPRFATNLFQR